VSRRACSTSGCKKENFAEVFNVLTRIFLALETACVALLELIRPLRAMLPMLILADAVAQVLRAD
jgi:hypothetical protein